VNERMDIRTFLPTADGRTFPPLMLLGRHAGVDLKMERGHSTGGSFGCESSSIYIVSELKRPEVASQ